MRLAIDDIVIQHGRDAVRLRPSLRAAMRLERRHGVRRLVQGIRDGSLTIIADIMAEADEPATAKRILFAKIEEEGVGAFPTLFDPLASFIAASFGFGDNDAPAKNTKPVPMEQALTELFEIGTGWLEWSPAETWTATPAEILAAQRGLIAKLKAIHGNGEEQKPEYDPREEISPEQASDGIARLKALTGKART